MRPAARNSLLLALALAAGHAFAADGLGTLFTSPEERARLDRLRRGEPVTQATSEPGAVASRHKPSITGYVQRSDGRDTVWIDGRPVVIANPGAQPLQPGIVRSSPSDRVIKVEPQGQPGR